MAYFKQAFQPESLAHAKSIVLTPDPREPDKFEKETAFLVDFIGTHTPISEASVVLDFGCGMGRVSRKLIERFSCRVVGVDVTEGMRVCATGYVQHPEKFQAVARYEGNDVDIIVSSFVLQHAEDPATEIERLAKALKPGGYFVLLEGQRLVPAGADAQGFVIWNDDYVSIPDLMAKHFEKVGSFGYYKRENEKILSLWRKPLSTPS